MIDCEPLEASSDFTNTQFCVQGLHDVVIGVIPVVVILDVLFIPVVLFGGV